MFDKGVKEYVEKLLSQIPERDPAISVDKINIQEDHIHMGIVILPKYAVARVVQYIIAKEGIWSRGYYVSCIGLDEK